MTVLAINNMNNANQEFISYKNSLQFQDWVYQTQNIIQATGLPLTSEFTQKQLLLPNGSIANRFGHKTLADFITSSDNHSGLGIEWSSWENQYNAFQFKNQFGIYEDDINEIISQVKDIETALGRMPVNSAEYHKAKEEILLKQKREAEVRHQNEKRELTTKIENLGQEIKSFQQNITDLETKLEVSVDPSVLDSYSEQLSQKEQEIIALKAQVKTLENNIGYSAELNIEKLIGDFEKTLGFIERFREQNRRLKTQVATLTNQVTKLESKLTSKENAIKNLEVKNKNLFAMQLLTGSVFFVTASALLLFILMLA